VINILAMTDILIERFSGRSFEMIGLLDMVNGSPSVSEVSLYASSDSGSDTAFEFEFCDSASDACSETSTMPPSSPTLSSYGKMDVEEPFSLEDLLTPTTAAFLRGFDVTQTRRRRHAALLDMN
jgi:hypothetical protein